MPRSSLSHLYFESVSVCKAPLKWLLCASFIHAGLYCLPIRTQRPREHGILFREGNAGIEVELIPESWMSAPAVAAPDSSREGATPLSEPDSPGPEAEYAVASKQIATSSLPPANPRRSPASDRTSTVLPRAGSAIAQPAAQIYTTQPPYPVMARELGVEGVVRLRVRIGVDGRPREVRVVHPSGRSDFDLSSVTTVQREWRFRPARTKDGAVVESTIVVAIKFALKS